MSSYLASNQPYGRVDDGIGAGFIGGAIAGGSIAGAFHSDMGRRTAKMGMRGIKNSYKGNLMDLQNEVGMLPSEKQQKKIDKLSKRVEQSAKATQGIDKIHSKAFKGGGWRTAGVYGGSVLAGSLFGMGVDALND